MEIDPQVITEQMMKRMVFAGDFSRAMQKLNRAELDGTSCKLSLAEVRATLQGFRLLKDAHKEGK